VAHCGRGLTRASVSRIYGELDQDVIPVMNMNLTIHGSCKSTFVLLWYLVPQDKFL